jgi:hypothetical protein
MNQLRGSSDGPVNRLSRPQLSSLRTLLPILLSTLLLIPLLYGLLASSHAFDQLRHILLVLLRVAVPYIEPSTSLLQTVSLSPAVRRATLSFPRSASLRHILDTSLRATIHSAEAFRQISEHIIVLLPLRQLVIRRIHGSTFHVAFSAFRSMASSSTSKARYSQL